MIMACSSVKIYKHIALSKGRDEIINAKALQNQNAVVVKKLLVADLHDCGFNEEGIQQFCASLVI